MERCGQEYRGVCVEGCIVSVQTGYGDVHRGVCGGVHEGINQQTGVHTEVHGGLNGGYIEG